ncbi:type II toxin-antitoxin system VapC family toxin [Streptomyces sp. WMMC500]|uniref:type II toxin-antitoxin system VapC family toxin n=1 Tax=Streptomyces sp. WMMC500 TaxID=3015154 RepID=UPI00248D1717|nr:type II toxin-antitoxin system VapC family toxin [Streptomyces sp. WMMC500]WBB57767.1 type II toxin-antitoxin system VapC family toxin [Streptomyces sp. WMMC500]
MIVVDSSAVVDLLVDTGTRGKAAARHLAGESLLWAPYLIDTEVASVLLRLERAGMLAGEETTRAVTDYRTLPIRRHEHLPLLERVRQLGSVRSYDAFYVALAEGLDAPLLTSDARLARAPGPRCRIINLHDET